MENAVLIKRRFRTTHKKTCVLSLCLVCAFTGCLTSGGSDKGKIAVERTADSTLSDEVVALTQALIRSRPVNPPGQEHVVTDILARYLEQHNIAVELDTFEDDGRVNLMARVPGTDPALKPLVLVGHSDVVPAKAEDWSEPGSPFEAKVENGILYGRGSLDMLSMVAMETLVLVHISRLERAPARDLILLVVGDEEVDGLGMQAALKKWPRLLRAQWAINEGAYLLQDYFTPGEDIAAVSVAQKGVLQFRLTTSGEAGHGSSPSPDDAPVRLARAVNRIIDRPNPMTFTPESKRMFKMLGQARGGLNGIVMGTPFLLKRLGKKSISNSKTTSALVHNTCALTMVDAGYKRNVIPAEATATFDCRLLPGTAPSDFRDTLLGLVDDPRVKFETLMEGAANGSPGESKVIDVIRARINAEFPQTATVPILTKGLTDSRFLREKGIPCYGFIPIRVTPEELESLHGRDERVRVEELKAGLLRLIDISQALLEFKPQSTQGPR